MQIKAKSLYICDVTLNFPSAYETILSIWFYSFVFCFAIKLTKVQLF